jgi:hypothetical protein
MAPAAFDSYIRACFHAGVSPDRISQTIGTAPASAGVHRRDGILFEGAKPVPYCAAVDLRTRDLAPEQIRALLHHLAVQGFAGWFRHRGTFKANQHIHAIYAGLPMKMALQRQVKDFLTDRDGLASHSAETFWTAPAELDGPLRAAWVRANPKGSKRLLA